MSEDLELRILQAVHEPETVDVELIAHEIAVSDEAQVYLVQVIETISALSPTGELANRAGALLEHALAIAADHVEREQQATATTTAGQAKTEDPKPRS